MRHKSFLSLALFALVCWAGCGGGKSDPDPDCTVAGDCDDGDACTADSCADGQCDHQPMDCDDSDACTTDSCADGQCEHQPLDCDDGDGCTADSCTDGLCNHEDTCSCSSDAECDDEDPCTLDACDPVSGQCTHTPDPACPACSPTAQLVCGDTVTVDFSAAGSLIDSYSCEDAQFPGHERIYEVVSPGDHGLRATVSVADPMAVAPALVVMEGACEPSACLAASDFLLLGDETTLTIPAQAGTSYFIAVEEQGMSPGETASLRLDCVEDPLCDDGLDNEGDGLTDCDDPDCVHAAGCFCLDAPAPVGCNTLLAGDNTGLPALVDTWACDPIDPPGFYLGPETLHTFTAPATGNVRLSLTEVSDGFGLAVLDEACDPASDQSCLAFTSNAQGPDLDFTAQQGVTYTIVLDLAHAGYPGPYAIQLTCQGPEICDDTFDNDLDGDVDCLDTDCRDPNADPGTWDPACQAEANCGDGLDNDSDGTTDCQDVDCVDQTGPDGGLCEPGAEATCDDGADNDGDGQADCQDLDCDGQNGAGGVCQHSGEATCDDGFDNDGDGMADCEDWRCDGLTGPDGVPCESGAEQTCDDGIDNDGDGGTDCLDGDCWIAPGCFEWDCHNGLDDDGDGLTDCEDGNCHDGGVNPDHCFEEDCADGLDDDLDGLTDCDDTQDCNGDPACRESDCADGLDNDGNGLTDCQDSYCDGTIGPDGVPCEPIGEHSCADGFDNDGDTLIDCDDPQCFGHDGCACLGAPPVACGTTLSGDWGGQTSQVSSYACAWPMAPGPETVYAFNAAVDGPVQIRAAEGQTETLVFAVLDDTCEPNDWSACLAGTLQPMVPAPGAEFTAPVAFHAQAGQAYYLVVDSTADAPSTYQADILCPDQHLCSPGETLQISGWQQINGSFGPAQLDTWCGSSNQMPPGSGQAFYTFTADWDGHLELTLDQPGGSMLMVMVDLCNPDACLGLTLVGQPLRVRVHAGQTYYLGLMGQAPGMPFSLEIIRG